MKNTLQSNCWIKRPNPNPQAELRLFCFPYAGGWSVAFRNWSDSTLATVEVCTIELPGRGTRLSEAPLIRLDSLVEKISQALIPHLDKPFAFFGHSMGGLLCFEVTRFLSRNYGIVPAWLFVSGHRAPHLAPSNSPIHGLPESEFIEELRHFKGTPEAILVDPELRLLLFPSLRADFALLENYLYTPAPPLDCSIAAFGGLEDINVSWEELEAWRAQTNRSFSLHMIPGDHFFVHSSERLLIQLINQELGHSTEQLLMHQRNNRLS
jgi:medium-chain acyl-[acyl-carrier-protein] hydrolase